MKSENGKEGCAGLGAHVDTTAARPGMKSENGKGGCAELGAHVAMYDSSQAFVTQQIRKDKKGFCEGEEK